MDMGVDFGSTYTTVSIYNQKDKAPEAQRVSGQNDSTYVPSVVSVDKKGKFRYGVAAKNRTGESGARVFKAFKMLLNESDQERLKRRKYTEEYTPYAVTHKFLEYLLGKVRNQYNQNEKIEHLVVGVPEIWFEQLNTMDGQAIVREICQSFDFVDSTNVRVVSEPIAASAFFAHNYQKLKDKCYEGKIFLIDYGGGTLDITLTDVTVKDEYMTIKIDERCGKGENEEGKIGKAGILYMESVVEEALVCPDRAATIFGKENMKPHYDWFCELKARRPEGFTQEQAHQLVRQDVAEIFAKILEDAGVYKNTPAGKEAFLRFAAAVNAGE